MRLLVRPDRQTAVWCHYLETELHYPGWIDATDMSDTEFEALIRGQGYEARVPSNG